MKISDVMTPCPYKISSDKSLEEALKFFKLRNIRHIPVIDGDELIGLISLREVEMAKFLCDSSGFCPTIGQLCVNEPTIVTCNTPLVEVTQLMADKKNDCVLVADDDGTFVGIFTTTDVCKVVKLLLDQNKT